MNLQKAIEGYRLSSLADGLSPNTMNGYAWAFKRIAIYFDYPELEDITPEKLKDFFRYLHTQSNLSSSSIQSIWRTIRSFYNWASKELGIDRPDNNIPMPRIDTKTIIPFTEDDIKSLLKACDRRLLTSKRDKALILLLLDTGLRVSECARLTIEDVDLESGEIVVKPFRTGRKSKSRIVYISVKTRKAVWLYLTERTYKPSSYLFETIGGYSLNKDNVREHLARLSVRASVKGVHPHRFRHTFAIQFLRNGGDVFTLQRLLGHSSLEMVKKYVTLAQVDIKLAHMKASPVDNWKV